MATTVTDNGAGKPKRPKRQAASGEAPAESFDTMPDKFTYMLAQHTVERRATGWFFARSQPSFAGTKTEWFGPYKRIENVALAIARRNATEIADRHTRSIEHHGLDKKHKLYGLKPTTVL